MATIDTSPKDNGYGNPFLDSLIWGTKWSGTITYTFGQTSGQTWTATEQQAFRNAFANFSAVSGLVFQYVDKVADANLIEYEVPSSTWDKPGTPENEGLGTYADHELPNAGGGDGRYNADHPSWGDLRIGSDGYQTIIHELGHALGLEHPHDGTEKFPGVTSSKPTGTDGLNQHIWTMMSYQNGWNVQPPPSSASGYNGTLMAFDIAAIQELYGKNLNTATGNDTYTLPTINQSGTFWSCIWDAGGIDTISNAGIVSASTIDLRAAPLTGANAGGYVSWIKGIAGGFTIANGVVIENAIGGKGNDTITGNDADNVIEGGIEADLIDGKLGNDTASYASSIDGVVIDLRRATLETTDANYLAPAGGDAAGDVLISIENLIGSAKTDELHGRHASPSVLEGRDGDDTIFGYAGNDVIRGGLGADTIKDTGGNDVIYGADSDFIRNGSFETVYDPTFDANGYGYNEPIDGWAVLSGSHLELFKAGSTAGNPSDGKYGVDLEGNQTNTNVSISQVVDGLVDGQSYRLAFDVRRVAGADADAKFEVYWGGTRIDLTSAGAKEIVPGTDVTTYYLNLFGGAGTGADENRLTFREIGGGDTHGTLLDNVRMYRDAGGTNPAANAYDPARDSGDFITLGTGSDIVYGHGGDDVANFSDFTDIGPGVDQFDGGSGVDLLIMDWSASTTQIKYLDLVNNTVRNLSPDIGQARSYERSGATTGEAKQELFFTGVERFILKGGTGGDTLVGGELKDILVGNGGDDFLIGGGGGDEIDGGAGFDTAQITLSGNGKNTIDLKTVQNGGTITLSDGTKLISIESIALEAGGGDDFLDVRGTVPNPMGIASTELDFPSVQTSFDGKGGDDTLAIDLATSGDPGPFGVYGATFDGGDGTGDLLIMDWSAAKRDIFRDGNSYKSLWYISKTENHSEIPMFYTARFENVERFDLTGGTGNDVLYGGDGDDRIKTFEGRDTAHLGAGNDTLVVDYGTRSESFTFQGYTAPGFEGSLAAGYSGSFALGDARYGTARIDYTGVERFELTFGSGDDYLRTGDGADIVSSGAGNDHLVTGKGIDVIDGGAQNTTGGDRWEADQSDAASTQAINVDLQLTGVQSTYRGTGTVRGIEMLTLKTGAGNDTIRTFKADFNDALETGAGADRVEVYGGRDSVAMGENGSGLDTLVVDYGTRTESFTSAGYTAPGFEGSLAAGYAGSFALDDARYGSARVDYTGVERFELTFGSGDDYLRTGDGSDRVSAGAGNDYLSTGKGIDVVDGGAQNATGGDRWEADQSDATAAQAINVDLQSTGIQSTYRGTGTVRGIEMLTLKTGAGNDTIRTYKADFNDVIETGAGTDRVEVYGGRDGVAMGSGFDTLVVDYRTRTESFSSAGYTAPGFEGSLAAGYAGSFALGDARYGSARVDYTGVERFELTFGSGDDYLRTGDGSDSVSAGAGNDHLSTGRGIDVVDGGAHDTTQGRGGDLWEADQSDATATEAINVDLQAAGVQSTYRGTGTVRGIEVLSLKTGAGNDTIRTAATVAAFASTLGYDDVLDTGAGADRVEVFGGRDSVAMGSGFDTLVVDWSQIGGDFTFEGYAAAGFEGTLETGYSGHFSRGDARSGTRVDYSGVERFQVTMGAGNDRIRTGDSNDIVSSGAGNDYLNTGRGIDVVDGGAHDLASGGDRWEADQSGATAAQPMVLNLNATGVQATYAGTGSVRGIEMLTLKTGAGNDVIATFKADFNDAVTTGAGADRVEVYGGRDSVAMGENGSGLDTLVVDYGTRTESFTSAGYTAPGFEGSLAAGYAGSFALGDARYGSARVDYTGVERFELTFGSGDDYLRTGDGSDRVLGGAGNDHLSTGRGIDVIDGGAHNASGGDRWEADQSGAAATQPMVLDLNATGVQATYAGTGSVRGIEMLTLKTGAGNDTIRTYKAEFQDVIDTGAGADRVEVYGGRDSVVMGAGLDTLVVDYRTRTESFTFEGYTAPGFEGTLATGYSGSFSQGDARYGSARVDFSGVERFELTFGSGDDHLRGGDGSDVLNGGGGVDTLRGMGGDDIYVVDVQGDRVVEIANGGLDTVRTSVTYALESGQEIEVLTTTNDAGTGAINLTGNERVNSLRGNAGNNTLDGGLGADTMTGLAGNDTYLVNDAADKVYEAKSGGTLDTVKVAVGAVNYTLLAGQEIEALVAADAFATAALNLTGNEFAQTISGNAGANVLRGGGGADTLNGLGGLDTADYRDKTAAVEVALNGATLVTMKVGGVAEDKLVNIENVIGGTVADKLTGDGLANVLDGWSGADTLTGLGGNDTYYVDNVGDKVIEAVGGGADTVRTSVTYALGAGQEIEVLTTTNDAGTGAINLTGNERVNSLRGNAGANILDGGLGADTMTGLAGNDTYLVNEAGDKVYESKSGGTLDTVKVAAGAVNYALLAGQEIEALVAADAFATAALNLTGNEFAQTVTGNAGANVLRGGGGADTLNGLGGLDTADYRDKAAAVEVALNGATLVTMKVGGVAEDKLVNIENVIGGTVADKLTGDGLANVLDGWSGADTLTGLGGNDTYYVDNLADQVVEAVGGGIDTVLAQTSYVLAANQEIEVLATAAPTSTTALNLTGNAFAQAITGNAGANILIGGGGVDRLTGGLGRDTFDFNAKTETGSTATTRDVILDFKQGEDRIDLSTIDANGTLAGDAFEFLTKAGSAFTGKAGQLTFTIEDAAGTANDRTIVQADMDGNKIADFQIELKGLYTLTSADFVL